ncbi:hypothetical protein [Pseudoduganella violaceinigra]|uniref:hypothetical protein n=1 Tax=Pseudoduganella violaceinigra TaxID=246602 RepID=UPI000481E14E|nr:hypothetical protein [Pseudoduganella violaceinigra]
MNEGQIQLQIRGQVGQFSVQINKGKAPYPKERYALGVELQVAYAAAWPRGQPFAFLVRQATPNPEVTIVHAEDVEAVPEQNESELTN